MPSTVERVARNTRDGVNQRIRRRTAERLAYYITHTREIPRRLRELDEEWDIERALEANAATVTMGGVVLAGLDRRWLALPALVGAFLFQHATQGWCPPLPVLRELGFRTAREIEIERVALKLLRGDFDVDTVSGTTAENAEAAMTAAAA